MKTNKSILILALLGVMVLGTVTEVSANFLALWL
jgi:hypothetical protein